MTSLLNFSDEAPMEATTCDSLLQELQAAVKTIRGSRGVVPASESPNGDSTGGQLEFKAREDVEKLLAEKLNPKNRNNDMGRNKELRDNIKKFKACINWYMKLEDGYLKQEKLRVDATPSMTMRA